MHNVHAADVECILNNGIPQLYKPYRTQYLLRNRDSCAVRILDDESHGWIAYLDLGTYIDSFDGTFLQ